MVVENLAFLKGLTTYGAAVITAAAAAVTTLLGLRKGQEEFSTRAKQERELGVALKRLELWEKRSGLDEILLSGHNLEFARAQTRAAIEAIWQQTNDSLALLASWEAPPKPWRVGAWRRTFLLYPPPPGQDYLAGITLRIVFLLTSGSAFVMLLAMSQGFWFLIRDRADPAAVAQISVFLAPLFFFYFALLAIAALIQYWVQREGLSSKVVTLPRI